MRRGHSSCCFVGGSLALAVGALAVCGCFVIYFTKLNSRGGSFGVLWVRSRVSPPLTPVPELNCPPRLVKMTDTYGGAWLIGRDALLAKRAELQEMKRSGQMWTHQLESGSFFMLGGKQQWLTEDILDFSVGHLASSYGIRESFFKWPPTEDIEVKALLELEQRVEALAAAKVPYCTRDNETLAFVPTRMFEDDYSRDAMRGFRRWRPLMVKITLLILCSCFDKVVVVAQNKTREKLRNMSLPEYVWTSLELLTDVNESAQHSLPMYSIHRIAELLHEGAFLGKRYVYFSEDDQPLHMRHPAKALFEAAARQQRNPNDVSVIVPHRLQLVPREETLNTTIVEIEDLGRGSLCSPQKAVASPGDSRFSPQDMDRMMASYSNHSVWRRAVRIFGFTYFASFGNAGPQRAVPASMSSISNDRTSCC